MKTRVSLKCFVNNCFWKHFFASNSPQTPTNLVSLTMLVTLKPFTQLIALKPEKLICKNVLYLAFTGNCFSDLFTEVKIWYYKTFKFIFGRFSQR